MRSSRLLLYANERSGSYMTMLESVGHHVVKSTMSLSATYDALAFLSCEVSIDISLFSTSFSVRVTVPARCVAKRNDSMSLVMRSTFARSPSVFPSAH